MHINGDAPNDTDDAPAWPSVHSPGISPFVEGAAGQGTQQDRGGVFSWVLVALGMATYGPGDCNCQHMPYPQGAGGFCATNSHKGRRAALRALALLLLGGVGGRGTCMRPCGVLQTAGRG